MSGEGGQVQSRGASREAGGECAVLTGDWGPRWCWTLGHGSPMHCHRDGAWGLSAAL